MSLLYVFNLLASFVLLKHLLKNNYISWYRYRSVWILNLRSVILAVQVHLGNMVPVPAYRSVGDRLTFLLMPITVADPDPGSGAFLTPGSGIGFFRIPDPKTIFLRAF
jgi:hypothetical protein